MIRLSRAEIFDYTARDRCYFCSNILGKGDDAEVQRYLPEGAGNA